MPGWWSRGWNRSPGNGSGRQRNTWSCWAGACHRLRLTWRKRWGGICRTPGRDGPVEGRRLAPPDASTRASCSTNSIREQQKPCRNQSQFPCRKTPSASCIVSNSILSRLSSCQSLCRLESFSISRTRRPSGLFRPNVCKVANGGSTARAYLSLTPSVDS